MSVVVVVVVVMGELALYFEYIVSRDSVFKFYYDSFEPLKSSFSL